MAIGPTGYVFDPRFLMHDTGESARTLPDGTVMDAVEHYSNNRITRHGTTNLPRERKPATIC